MRALVVLMLSTLAVGAYAGAAPDPTGGALLKPLITERERAAGQTMDEIEAMLAAARALPPEQRRAKEAQFGRPLERALDKATGTKHENKALYYLALWRFAWQPQGDVAGLLDRIDRADYPGFKNPARALKVQLLLRQGEVREARTLAERLVEKVPEFRGVLDLVAFHERVGRAAPRRQGRNLGGGPADPLAAPEPWQLWIFADADDASLDRVRGWLAALPPADRTGRVRLVCVSFAPDALRAAAIRSLPGVEGVELLWAVPGAEGDAAAWREDWALPGLPATVLLGPDRTILAVEPDPARLRPLLGLGESSPPPRPRDGSRGGGGAPWMR